MDTKLDANDRAVAVRHYMNMEGEARRIVAMEEALRSILNVSQPPYVGTSRDRMLVIESIALDALELVQA